MGFATITAHGETHE